jgi:hypothetical protein
MSISRKFSMSHFSIISQEVLNGLLVAMGLFAFSPAFADTVTPQGEGKPIFARPITWDEFKERCANPGKFPDVQIAPQHIQFQCLDAQRDWVSDQPGSIPLAGWRMVRGAVISDKFAVADAAREFMIPTKGGSCLRFKEVERLIKLEVPLSCGDVLGFKGGVLDYCQMATSSAKGANPKLIASRDTGRLIDTCSGFLPPPPGKDR